MKHINSSEGMLGWTYKPAGASYACEYRHGAWGEGYLTGDHTMALSESAGVLHICQQVCEGLMARRAQDGRILCVRPQLNAERMVESAMRLVMPPFYPERFLEALRQVVVANASWVAPYGTGASLLIRAIMVATGATLTLRPASAYEFRMIATPVGPYFPGGVSPVRLIVSDYDRAAPQGSGAIKAGLNFAMSLWPLEMARSQGFDDALYLDAATHTYVEGTSGANVIFVDPKGALVVPTSPTHAQSFSITCQSVVELAREQLGMEVVERPVRLDELGHFSECGLCHSAAVIEPVMSVADYERDYLFNDGLDEIGPILGHVRQALVDIQEGTREGPKGWVMEIR